MSEEKKLTFFRQSGWMVIANTLCGMFMVAVHPFASQMPGTEWSLFTTLLRFFTILAIPAAGLQTVMAKEAAAAVTPEAERNLAALARRILAAIFGVWLLLAAVFFFFETDIRETFRISQRATLWMTVCVVLAAFSLPVVHGLLQGLQNFPWLGSSIILHGAGRFLGIILLVAILKFHSSGAITGTLAGILAAILVGIWPLRKLLALKGGQVDWGRCIRKVIPLSAGTGAIVWLLNADMLFVQSHFQGAELYAGGAIVGVGIVTFTAPMAWVMFPKLARSFALDQSSNALYLAAGGTAILGALAAILCGLFPELPVRIMFFRKPELWPAAQLIPWFAAALVPVTMANILVSDLLARERFAIVPWLAATAIGYGFTLSWFVSKQPVAGGIPAFKGIVQILSLFALLTLAISLLFTWLDRRKPSP